MGSASQKNLVEIEIGQRIRSLRLAKDINLDQLANQIRLTKGQVSKIENGLVSSPVSTLTRIAAALGIGVGELFRNHDQQSRATFVKKNKRKVIVGRGSKMGHSYESLAFGFPLDKAFEPYFMTIDQAKIDR